MKTALDTIQLWLHYFVAYFCKVPVVGASLLSSFLGMGIIRLPIFVALIKRHATWPLDTHESAKSSGVLGSSDSLLNLSQSTLSSDLAATSESLLMHSPTEAFICAKLKHHKTLISSVRWGSNVDKRKTLWWNFFSKLQWNSAYCVTFSFWQMIQCDPNSQNLAPNSHTCVTRQPACYACALQPRADLASNVKWAIS